MKAMSTARPPSNLGGPIPTTDSPYFVVDCPENILPQGWRVMRRLTGEAPTTEFRRPRTAGKSHVKMLFSQKGDTF